MPTTTTRRGFCESTSAAFAIGIAGLAGCGSNDDAPVGDDASTSSGDGGSTTAVDTASGSSGPTSAGASSSDATGTDTFDATGTSGDATSSSGADGPSPADTSGGTGTDTGAPACEPSPGSIEGPYYRPGMPIRSDLDIYGHAGVALHLRGRVVDGDCAAVPDAIVELWHAFPAPPGSVAGEADAFYDDTEAYQYYGQVATDGEGRYAFDTLRPGWYLNGDAYRPAHLHVKIWVGGVERLTTQLYFEGDPFNAGDPWFDPTMVLAPDDAGDVERDFAV